MNFDFLRDYIINNKAVLICTQTNRRYLSGFHSSLGYLFVSEQKKVLLVDGRYVLAAKKHTHKNIEVVLLENVYEQINGYIKQGNVKNVFLETEISVGSFVAFKDNLACEITALNELSKTLLLKRSVKEENEINLIVKAQNIAERAFNNILNYIKVGVSEKRIALELDYEMQRLGSEGVSFDTICVSGENSALPHGVPSDKLIDDGDFITMDFGAVCGGYHSDMTRTVSVSYATDEMIEVYETVLNAQFAAAKAIKSNVSCKTVDSIARQYITQKGYGEYFTHSTGHGVGLEIHEYPNLSARNDILLESNQVVTCEPGIYLQNKFGVRIEDMILVKIIAPKT